MSMRIRGFKWSTDIALPAAFVVVFVWGLIGGSPQVAFLGAVAFAIQLLYIARRVDRLRSDGSYGRLFPPDWYTWVDPAGLVFGLVGGVAVISGTLLFSGQDLLVSLLAGAAFAVLWTLAIAWFRGTFTR
jgi:hypothetical protein